jgi:histidinol-phosphate aminotransferase
LVTGLQALGFQPLPSQANFVTTDLQRPVAPIIKAMMDQGVLVRGLADPGFENFLRVTVGLPEENARALSTLATALA